MKNQRMSSLVSALCLFGMCLLGMSFSAGPANANFKETPTMTDPSQTPPQQPEGPVHSQLQVENKTEHVLHIALAGGNVLTVPPTVDGATHTLKFADAEERTRFEQALQTETVQQWQRDQHLVIHGGGSAPSSQQQAGPGPQVIPNSGAQSSDPAAAQTSPASRRGRGDRE